MAVYINQINKRRAAEKAAMSEVYEKTNERLGLRQHKHVVPQNDESALRQVLEALGITDYELEENDLLTPEEQLTGILRPRGIMMRSVRLKGYGGRSVSGRCWVMQRMVAWWLLRPQKRVLVTSIGRRTVQSKRCRVAIWRQN